MIAMAFGLALIAPEAVRIIGGRDEYAGAAFIVPWIAFSYALYAGVLYVQTGITVVNKTYLILIVMAVGSTAKIGLNIALIPVLGNYGAAMATFAAFWLECIGALLITQRVFPVPYPLGRIGVVFGCAFVGGLSMAWWGELSLGRGIAVRLAMSTALVGLMLATNAVRVDEIKAVWGSIRKRLGAV